MIIKLELNGEQYHNLLGVLQTDANYYTDGAGRRVPFVNIMKSKSKPSQQRSEVPDAVPDQIVELQVDETYVHDSSWLEVPLSVLTRALRNPATRRSRCSRSCCVHPGR